MYRKSLDMDNSNDQYVFLRRVTGYPVVNRVILYTTDVYTKAKDYNGLVKYTLNTAEKTVLVAADRAKPVMAKLETPITVVDSLACMTLDKLEEKVPMVKKTPDEIVEETRKLYNATIVEPALTRYNNAKAYGLNKVTAVKDYSVQTAVVLMDNKYGQMLTVSLDQFLLKADYYMDNYIPLPKLDGRPEEPKMHDDGNPVSKMVVLSKKFRQRVVCHGLIQLRAAKKRTDEILSNLHITVDLLQHAKSNLDSTNKAVKERLTKAQERILQLWDEFNKDADAAGAKTFEQKLLYVAGQLTNQLHNTYNKLASTLALLPAHIQPNVKLVQDFIGDLYAQFSKANSWDDVSSVVIAQWRDGLLTLQTLCSQSFDSFLNSRVISWLVKTNLDERKITQNGSVSGSSPAVEQEANDVLSSAPPSSQIKTDQQEMSNMYESNNTLPTSATNFYASADNCTKKQKSPNNDLSD